MHVVSAFTFRIVLFLFFSVASSGVAYAAENIYTDAAGTNWSVTGWSATSSAQTTPVHQGTQSLAVQYTGEWGGFLFERVDGINTPIPITPTEFTHVTFAVNAGATVSPNLASVVVHLNNGSGSKPLVNYLPGNSWAANQWQVVRIPLADLNSANANFNRIVIQSQVQTAGYGFSIDSVSLDSGSTTTPPPPGGSLQSCANIMPLGDSITAGTNGNYRNDLYTGLLQNNCGVSYVGTLYDSNTTVADKDHEGHGGLTIGGIAAEVNGWLASTQPDIILLMIGTNDTAWWTNDTAEQHAANHNALVAQLRQQRPNAWIFVASIPPQTSKMIHGRPDGTLVDRAILTRDFNVIVKSNVDARIAAGERVRFVDVHSALTVEDLVQTPEDGVHPKDPAAYAKIAAKFLQAVRAALATP